MLLLVLVVELLVTRVSGGSSSKHDRKYRQTRNTIHNHAEACRVPPATRLVPLLSRSFFGHQNRDTCANGLIFFIPAQFFCFLVRLQILHSCRFILQSPKFLGSRSKQPNNQGRSTTVSYKFAMAAKRKPREDCIGILLYRDSGLIMCCFVTQNHFP